jgi:uncharacterized protein YndB with AHSA1/START domain
MIENTITLTLDQPPERVFDFLVDFPHEPTWNPECLEVEKTSPGPVGAGSTYRGRMRGVGQISMELTAHERPRRFATTERSRAATGSFEFLLTPRGAGTQVEIGMQLRPRGVMWLLQPLMRRMSTQFLAKLPDYMRKGLASADQVA